MKKAQRHGLTIAVQKAFERMTAKDYPFMYIAVDLHDTITQSTYSAEKESHDFYRGARETLQYLSNRKDIVLILWTSSFSAKMQVVFEWFKEQGINFKYLNENPECPNTPYGDFSRKFYYDILLDDKAGFIPKKDWYILRNAVQAIPEKAV